MFANFQISAEGFNPVKATVKHHRTATGCYPCRVKKKKCDEHQPICSRCRRQPSECVYPTQPTAVTIDGRQRDRHSSDIEEISDYSSLELVTQSNSPPEQRFTRYITISHPWNIQLGQFDIGQRGELVSLLIKFDDLHSTSYADRGISPVNLGMRYALHSPALLHAFVACGATLASLDDSRWTQVALQHYLQATKLVSDALANFNETSDDDWLLATVNALHIFETLRHDVDHPDRIHLTAAHTLYKKSINQGKALTLFRKVLLEEYILQSAISSTFAGLDSDSNLQYHDIHHLLRQLTNTTSDDALPADWRSSCMGISHNMFDYVFRLSYLRRCTPLTGWHLHEAITIMTRLSSWKLPSSLDSGPPQEMLVMAELYRVGCLILVHKILNPALTARHPLIREFVRLGCGVIKAIPESELKQTTVLIWPIVMVGIASLEDNEKRVCRRPLDYLVLVSGIGCVRTVLGLLDKAWEVLPTSQDGESLGLDVLFMDEYLRNVTF